MTANKPRNTTTAGFEPLRQVFRSRRNAWRDVSEAAAFTWPEIADQAFNSSDRFIAELGWRLAPVEGK